MSTHLKNQLIKLGSTNPELRKHLRPILDNLTKKAASDVLPALLVYAELSFHAVSDPYKHVHTGADLLKEVTSVLRGVPGIENISQKMPNLIRIDYWTDDIMLSHEKDKAATLFRKFFEKAGSESVPSQLAEKVGVSGHEANVVKIKAREVIEEDLNAQEVEKSLAQHRRPPFGGDAIKNFRVESVRPASGGGTEIHMSWEHAPHSLILPINEQMGLMSNVLALEGKARGRRYTSKKLDIDIEWPRRKARGTLS